MKTPSAPISLLASTAVVFGLAAAPSLSRAQSAKGTDMLKACGVSLSGTHLRENRYSTPAKAVPAAGVGFECDFARLDGPMGTALVVGTSLEASMALQPILRESAINPGHMMQQETAPALWLGPRLRFELPAVHGFTPYITTGVDYDFASMALPRSTIEDLTDPDTIKKGRRGTPLNSSAWRNNIKSMIGAGVHLPETSLLGTALNTRVQLEWGKSSATVVPARDWNEYRGTNEVTFKIIMTR